VTIFTGKVSLPEESRDVEPIASDNLSAVYRSTSTRSLKVAFSVPVWNGLRGEERAAAGVLAMSVDLGDFRVLDEGELSGEKEVLLVDLRNDEIEGKKRRGLILHHRDLGSASSEEPPRLSAELLERIDMLRKESGVESVLYRERLLTDYPDPLGRSATRFLGAFEPVVITTREGQKVETDWIVLVQQPMR
jgi:hypothetical protein